MQIEKDKLSRFIQKYHLGGEVNSVKWSCHGDKLTTSLVTANKSLLGNLEMKKFPMDKIDLGIYKTKELKGMLSVLGSDVDVDIKQVDNKAYYLTVKNGSTSLDYVLSDLSVIPDPPALKKLPDFDTTLKLDTDFIDTFVKAKSALSDVDTFTLVNKNDGLDVIIGYASSTHTNRVTIDSKLDGTNGLTKDISFNANLFKEVLLANKECTSGLFEISNEGLGKLTFNVDDFSVTYFMVADSGNN